MAFVLGVFDSFEQLGITPTGRRNLREVNMLQIWP